MFGGVVVFVVRVGGGGVWGGGGGELFEGEGVIRGMGSYYFESVILPKSLRFLLNLAIHMTTKTELPSGNKVLQLLD